MASLDFETEKNAFREFYDGNWETLEGAKDSFSTLVRSLLASDASIPISKIESRIKDREECISKFTRKYRKGLEDSKTPYAIIDHLTDLVGLRIVCLYEDDVEKVRSLVSSEFEVLGVTDKITQIETTEGSFGYKGLHLDLRLNAPRKTMMEYSLYAQYGFELQIRTVVQDSWSIVDHKIKYKKSIPNELKRRINTLAALFELADREFRAIRDATTEEIHRSGASYEEISQESEESRTTEAGQEQQVPPGRYAPLNAFSFLKIASHFFQGYEFEPHKVDGFTQEIVEASPGISRGKFNFYLKENISEVKRYQQDFERDNDGDTLNPFTVIRHCLYAGDPHLFYSMLTDAARSRFLEWRERSEAAQAEEVPSRGKSRNAKPQKV